MSTLRRILVALLNTLALMLVGMAMAATLAGSWLVWGIPGLAWAAVPCSVIASGLTVWLATLAEGEDARAQSVHRNPGAPRGRP